MTGVRLLTGRTFRSLRLRNYRLFLAGQLVSNTGTGMQVVAQSWLVLELTDSGVALGVAVALQFLPLLLFGAWGGLAADRLDKRRLLIATQSTSAVLALVLGLLVASGAVQLWMVYGLAFLLGCVTAVDLPGRQSFVTEMVGPSHVPNAVGLNSAVFNFARLLGPAAAGIMIARFGVAPAFLVNAFSFVPVIVGLAAMRTSELFRHPPVARARGQIRDGLRHVWATSDLRFTLGLLFVVATFGFNFNVVLPLLARRTFGGDARLYGVFTGLMALGSLGGALVTAARTAPSRRLLEGAVLGLSVFTLLAASAPTAAMEGLVLVGVGGAVMVFLATANSTLQLSTSTAMRGRVMALYGLVFLGSNPVGGPVFGWLSERSGPRAALAVGGLVSLAAAAVAMALGRRASGPPTSPTPDARATPPTSPRERRPETAGLATPPG